MKRLALVSMAFMMILTLAACGSDSEEAVATVNDEAITKSEWQNQVDQMRTQYEQYGMDFDSEDGEAMLEQIEEQALESLIQQEVLFQKAIEEGFDADSKEVDAEMETIEANYDSKEAFIDEIEEFGYTEESLREQFVEQFTIQAFIDSEVSVSVSEEDVTEDDIQEAYDQYVAQTEQQGNEPEDLEDMEDELKDQVLEQKEQQQEQEAVQQIIADAKESYDINRNL